MKKQLYQAAVFSFLLLLSINLFGQTEPWTTEQLLEPQSLAILINDSLASKPLIINIGPAGSIKGSIKIGPANDKDNLEKLRYLLSNEDKKRTTVIYCGCCPFKNCPNIRPAFLLLKKMKFTDPKLLNLPNNLKIDWINHQYPMAN
jgi:hypothetical protein